MATEAAAKSTRNYTGSFSEITDAFVARTSTTRDAVSVNKIRDNFVNNVAVNKDRTITFLAGFFYLFKRYPISKVEALKVLKDNEERGKAVLKDETNVSLVRDKSLIDAYSEQIESVFEGVDKNFVNWGILAKAIHNYLDPICKRLLTEAVYADQKLIYSHAIYCTLKFREAKDNMRNKLDFAGALAQLLFRDHRAMTKYDRSLEGVRNKQIYEFIVSKAPPKARKLELSEANPKLAADINHVNMIACVPLLQSLKSCLELRQNVDWAVYMDDFADIIRTARTALSEWVMDQYIPKIPEVKDEKGLVASYEAVARPLRMFVRSYKTYSFGKSIAREARLIRSIVISSNDLNRNVD